MFSGEMGVSLVMFHFLGCVGPWMLGGNLFLFAFLCRGLLLGDDEGGLCRVPWFFGEGVGLSCCWWGCSACF